MDLFFTLSGYLITRLLLRERDETGDINLKAFYVRRTLRIWPLYYFSIALAFILSQLPASITSAQPFVANVFAPMPPIGYLFMATFVYNFNFYGTLLTNPPPFMAQLWSLSVEEQFYLFWPWFARYMPRRRIVVVPILMIAVGMRRSRDSEFRYAQADVELHLRTHRSDSGWNFDSTFAGA